MTKKMTKSELNETARLILAANAKAGAKDTTAKAKPEPVQLSASTHKLIEACAKSEVGFDKAVNAVYMTFASLVRGVIVECASNAVRQAVIVDIYRTFGDARKPAAIQRITMLNNCIKIAHGAPATKDTPAQAAQGIEAVEQALTASATLPALKKALQIMKSAKHGATRKVKPKDEAKADKAPAKVSEGAQEVKLPDTRKAALDTMARLLQDVARVHLKTADHALVLEIDKVVKMLKAA